MVQTDIIRGKKDVGSLSYNALSAVMMHLVVNIVSLSSVTRHWYKSDWSLKTETVLALRLHSPFVLKLHRLYYYSAPAKLRFSYDFKKEAGKGDQ